MAGGRSSPQKEWRTLDWLPGYEISESGEVRHSVKRQTRPMGYVLKGCTDSQGYHKLKVTIGGRKVQVKAHRLVCEAFNGPSCGERVEVAHGDGNRRNNHYSNLRWATRQENNDDRKLHGTDSSGERNPRAKMTWGDVHRIRAKFDGTRKSICALARDYGMSEGGMRAICSERNWRE